MKKLYIPTTTLNFNNILSSESISPKSFYGKRSFGYNRWFSIPENNFDNAIMLYESLSSFTRPKSDYEDHPLLIEISFREEDISKLSRLREGVYCCDHTIYLTPWNAKFFFFSDEDKRITLSMSDSSLETKLLKLYSKRFFYENPKDNYTVIPDSDTFNINSLEIDKDIRINKMKGLLYGYYIGALLSTPLESVKQLNILREILNIFAAILSSLDKNPTESQHNRLDSLFEELRKDDPFYTKLLNAIGGDTIKTNQVLSLIKYEYGYLKTEIDEEHLLKDLRSKEQSDSKNPSIAWIESKILQQESKISRERHPLSTDKSEIIVIDNKLSAISNSAIKDETEKTLFKFWINNLFSSKEYNGKISSFKEKISDEATTMAKDIYQENWTDSYAKEFLNKLRRHVRGDEFGQQWDNSIFSSIAAVITNGGEWTKLYVFMQSKEIYDYRLAFAMFGCLNGFANLTRDFTDIIYLSDSKYIMEIYTEFHGQLFGNSPVIEFSNQNYDSDVQREETSKLNNGVHSELILEKEHVAIIQQANETEIKCRKELKAIKLKEAQIDSIIEVCKKYHFHYSENVFSAISNIKGQNIGKVTVGKIKNALSPYLTTSTQKNEPTLFEINTEKERDIIGELSCFKGGNQDAVSRLKENWRFVETDTKTTRKEKISYFINLCKKEGEGRSKKRTALFGYFTNEIAADCKNELERLFSI